MKTSLNFLRIPMGLLASSILGTAAIAGPGPQFWNRPAAKSAQAAESASKSNPASPAKCDACKTSPIWGTNNREPAGKGAAGARLLGSRHECARCPGVVTMEKNQVNDRMTHNAACSQMLCCK
jgi:hypothetical protein